MRTWMIEMSLGAYLAVTGCVAHVPLAPQAEDARVRNLKPTNETALVYLFRDENLGADLLFTVEMDGKHAGETASWSYFLWEVTPGDHTLISYTSKSQLEGSGSTLHITTEAGKTYYVWQEVKIGWTAGRPLPQPVTVQDGRRRLARCRLIHAFKRAPAHVPSDAVDTSATTPSLGAAAEIRNAP